MVGPLAGDESGGADGDSALLQNWDVGTQTGRPQHVFTRQIEPPAQAPLAQSASPAQGVLPSTQRPPPLDVEPHTPLEPQLPPGLQVVKVEQVWPVHSGSGLVQPSSI